jgi:hypothetical protein
MGNNSQLGYVAVGTISVVRLGLLLSVLAGLQSERRGLLEKNRTVSYQLSSVPLPLGTLVKNL